MKNALILAVLSILLSVFIFCFAGCRTYTQPGETAAEGHRRHLRNLSINQQAMMEDIDSALLFDKPTKLTEKRLLPDSSD